MKKLYRWLCKKYGPEGLTLSAYAWKTGSRWVVVIDSLFFWQPNHCRKQFDRETR